MPSADVLQVLLFLLPGLVAEEVVDLLSVREQKSDLGRVVATLIMAVPIYVVYALVKGTSR